MKFPFRKRDDDKDEGPYTMMKVVNLPTLARWYLYDTDASSPNDLANAIGLASVSEEGEKTERRASESRSARVEPYIGFLKAMAEINAITITTAQGLRKEGVEEEYADIMQALIQSSSYLAMYSAFSAAFELGLIINPGTIGTSESENE